MTRPRVTNSDHSCAPDRICRSGAHVRPGVICRVVCPGVRRSLPGTSTACRGRRAAWSWACVNVTPDSFSDGGRYLDHRPRRRARAPAGPRRAPTSSTSAASRPGPVRSGRRVDEELDRVVPVVERLAAAGCAGARSTRCGRSVAEAAVARRRGARQRRLRRPGRRRRCSPRWPACGAPYVLMHWRAHSQEMPQHADYDDVVGRRGHRAAASSSHAALGGRHRRGADRPRPRHRLLQDRRAELAGARGPRSAARAGPPAPGRDQPQAVPRHLLEDSTARRARRWSARTPPRPRPPSPRRPAPGACAPTHVRATRRRRPGRRPVGRGRLDERRPRGGRAGERRLLRGVRERRPRRDARPVARRRRRAVRAPGRAAGPRAPRRSAGPGR